MPNQKLPLEGITVISLEQAVAAPLCTRRLRLAGAEVIKIERPEGDFARGYDTAVKGQSSYFVWANGGKKSVVLDLQSEAGVAQLRGLLAQADVLVQNLKPGAMSRLGLDLEALHEELPQLISVSIAGFHPSGPGTSRKAYDLLMQAESGLADITGSAHEPGRVGVSIVDASTGMYAYESVLEALLRRAQTGQGEQIDVALFDAVADLLTVPYLLARYGAGAPERVGLSHPGICPYGVFASVDKQKFILSIQNEREWQRLCTVGLERTDLVDDARCVNNETRVANRDFVDGEVQDTFAELTYAQIDARLNAADLAFAPVNSLLQLRDHPDFHTFTTRVGEHLVDMPRVPGLAKPNALSLPDLGEHTSEVLARLESTRDK